MTLRLNPELSRKVWKLAYPIILANLSLTLEWEVLFKMADDDHAAVHKHARTEQSLGDKSFVTII